MNRITYGATLALIMTAVAAPSAGAAEDVGTGGTPLVADAAAPAQTSVAAPVVSSTRTVTLTRTQTKSVQRKVRVRPDGALGSRTRSALRRYQTQRALKPTGRPNIETLKKMRLAFAATIERRLSSTAHTTVATPAALSTAIATAQAQIGTPYRNAGTSPGGFDCSGLMVWAFKAAGIDLPRTSFEQIDEGVAVERAAIQPGDLVFFSTAGPGASHVGVATSATTVISSTTSGVMEHRLNDGYWGAAYVGARRLTAG